MTARKAYNLLRNPFIILLTVPAGIALGIGFSPFFLIPLEKLLAPDGVSLLGLTFNTDSARSLVATIAAGAMTALSLTYSLVLLVFTLAAGNIGPRLLKRFTSELANQVTAGILGGTFLYALFLLAMLPSNSVPTLTVAGAIFLSTLSVVQLIYFVRHVSQSISIDEEVAQIAQRVTQQLIDMRERGERRDGAPDSEQFEQAIESTEAGYVGWVDEKKLIDLAQKNDLSIWLDVPSGGFVLTGEVLARVRGEMDEDLHEQITDAFNIQMSRAEHRTAEFSINLLVEIALRALSPGINDTFTALAVANGLCNAFAEIGSEGFSPLVARGDDNQVRLVVAAMSLSHLVNQAFYPLRQSTSENLLMAEGLARTYSRLYSVGADEMRWLMAEHTRLLLRDLTRVGHLQHDIERVRACLPEELRRIDKK